MTVLLCTRARVERNSSCAGMTCPPMPFSYGRKRGRAVQSNAVWCPFGRLQSILDEQRPVTGNMGFVFINPITLAPYSMRQSSMKLMLKRLCEKAGVTPFGFYAIRHYFCRQSGQIAEGRHNGHSATSGSPAAHHNAYLPAERCPQPWPLGRGH